jgi:hypothetical protein
MLSDRLQHLTGYRGGGSWEVGGGGGLLPGRIKIHFFLCMKFNARSWYGHGLVDSSPNLLGRLLGKIKEN